MSRRFWMHIYNSTNPAFAQYVVTSIYSLMMKWQKIFLHRSKQMFLYEENYSSHFAGIGP